MSGDIIQLHSAFFAALVVTRELWAGVDNFGSHRAVTTHMTEPEPVKFLLRLASPLVGAITICAILPVATAVMFAVTFMVMPTRHDGSLW